MPKNQLVWEGLQEFRKALRELPFHLRDEAARVVHEAAQTAHDEIKAAYPTGPRGNLKRGLSITLTVSGNTPSPGRGLAFGAGAVVKNRAPHARLFEHGSEARYLSTPLLGRAGNWGVSRGRMPANPTFIPIAMRHRARMTRRLVDIIRRAGDFEVTGG